jgi:hypothetical protein
MNLKRGDGKILPCPGLKVTVNAGVSWMDSARRVHELASATLLTIEQVAADPRMSEMGFGTYAAAAELVRAGRLYPVFRKNARVVRVFACAIPDFRIRCFSGNGSASKERKTLERVSV